MTFNAHKQRYEFVGKSDAEIDTSFVKFPENHKKCYYFSYISVLKSAALTTFPFVTMFVLCRNQQLTFLHLQEFVSIKRKTYKENLILPLQRTIFKSQLGSTSKSVADSDDDRDDSDMSMSTMQSSHDLKERCINPLSGEFIA